MASSQIKFTTSKAIDHWDDKANLMKFTGYIQRIEGLIDSTTTPSKWLYKVIANNDGREVRLLFWGDHALEWHKKLEMYQIIKITGGVIRATAKKWRKSTDTVSPMEFGRASTLEILGMFDITKGADEKKMHKEESAIEYIPTELKDVCLARGPVIITAWIKEHFRGITTLYGASYGVELICDPVYRMSVHVTMFIPRDDLLEGMQIAIKGTIDRRDSRIVLNCKSMNEITIIPDGPLMTEDEMDDAVESVPLFLKREGPESPDDPIMKIPKLA